MKFFSGLRSRSWKTIDTVFFIEHKYTGHYDAVGLQKPYELFSMLISGVERKNTEPCDAD